MRTFLIKFASLFALLLLTACSSHEAEKQAAIDTVVAPFASHAINVTLKAEPGLNSVNDMPNSCAVLIIQSAEKTPLEQLLNNPAQLKALFSGAGAEGAILQVDHFVAMPGQESILHIDRAENTRQIALVAGYFPFPSKKNIARVEIPLTVQEDGWWNKVWRAELMPLDINITLGSENIVNMHKSNAEPSQSKQENH